MGQQRQELGAQLHTTVTTCGFHGLLLLMMHAIGCAGSCGVSNKTLCACPNGAAGTYGEALQKPLLERSSAWYSEEGGRLMATLSVPDYLAHCEVGGHLAASATPTRGSNKQQRMMD